MGRARRCVPFIDRPHKRRGRCKESMSQKPRSDRTPLLRHSPVSKKDWPAAYDTAFPSTMRNRRLLTRRSPV